MNGRILFVDDEESMRTLVQIALEKDGHEVNTAADAMEGLAKFTENEYDLVIQDLNMPGMNGIELLAKLRDVNANIPVVILTAFSTWDTAVEAMRLGAYDYLKKPFDNNDMRSLVQRALKAKSSASVEPGVVDYSNDVRLIGSTSEIQEILALVRRVSRTDSTVVITGESGTGKELIARLVHLQSLRCARPFIAVNCGAFSEALLESEMFGHVKGAFTGAVIDKKGMLKVADGGTFFFDEIGEMSLPTQVRLLRALETKEFMPVGGTKSISSDVRFIAATNRDLKAMVEKGTFREDLFYRLNVIPVHLPPLRERREDIPLLAGHFLASYNRAFKRNIEGFDEEVMTSLMQHDWPGNIRELQNAVQRAVSLAEGERIAVADMVRIGSPRTDGGGLPPLTQEGFNLEGQLAEIEARYIGDALRFTDGNLTKAAEMLGISFRSIRYKVKKLKLDR